MCAAFGTHRIDLGLDLLITHRRELHGEFGHMRGILPFHFPNERTLLLRYSAGGRIATPPTVFP